MKIDQHTKELIKVMSDGVYEKGHIIAKASLCAVTFLNLFTYGLVQKMN